MSCIVCKLPKSPEIKCSSCDKFVCKKCVVVNPNYKKVIHWVSAWDDLQWMMSEDEARISWDLIDFEEGEFRCIKC